MAIVFPSNPTLNQIFSQGSRSWKWNGTAWEVAPSNSLSLINLESQNINVVDLTVTGTVIGITQTSALNDLTDVDAAAPSNAQVLSYNSLSGKWQATTANIEQFNGGTISNPLVINNLSNSTGTTSGALRVSGGIGIGGDMFIGGTIILEDEPLELRTAGSIRLWNSANTRYVGFVAPTNLSATRIYTLPASDGSAGQFLRTNGSGTLSWASAAGGSGGAAPGGVDGNIQFNSLGLLEGDAGLTFDPNLQILTTPSIVANGTITVSDNTASTSTTTGSFKTAGGAGIQGQINVGGTTNKFTAGTESISILTGTIVVTGGVGVSGRINAGSTVSSDPPPTNAEHLTNKRYVDANILAFAVAFGA
jgi:hypothetical protein